MKTTLAATLLLTGLLGLQAQERLSREEALKYAFFVSVDLKEMLNTPIPTDPDLKRPVALRQDTHGGLVLPESKLSTTTFANAGEEAKSVGQLWLASLAPMNGGSAVAKSKLHTVHVRAGDHEADAACCALAVRKTSGGGLELLVYGNEKEPVTRVPLKSISGKQEDPIDITAERQDNKAVVTLKFLGKYEASLDVTDPDQT
jgi:hypothetical protein